MENTNENLDSQIEETDPAVSGETTDDVAALKEKLADIEAKNRQLFERAKRAEGFELKDGHWTKVKEAPEPEAKSEKSSELDYGQKAFLKTYGIAGPDELTLVKSWLERTGDSLDALVGDDIFNAKLTSLREAKAAQAAVPTSKRGSPPVNTTADYWLDKPFEEVPKHLKSEVLNLKLKREKDNSMFTDKPYIVG